MTTLDLLHLTVDGSITNPYAAGAVVVWTIILCVVAAWMVRIDARSSHYQRECLRRPSHLDGPTVSGMVAVAMAIRDRLRAAPS